MNLFSGTSETACKALSIKLPKITVKSKEEMFNPCGRVELTLTFTTFFLADCSLKLTMLSIAGYPVCIISPSEL